MEVANYKLALSLVPDLALLKAGINTTVLFVTSENFVGEQSIFRVYPLKVVTKFILIIIFMASFK